MFAKASRVANGKNQFYRRIKFIISGRFNYRFRRSDSTKSENRKTKKLINEHDDVPVAPSFRRRRRRREKGRDRDHIRFSRTVAARIDPGRAPGTADEKRPGINPTRGEQTESGSIRLEGPFPKQHDSQQTVNFKKV